MPYKMRSRIFTVARWEQIFTQYFGDPVLTLPTVVLAQPDGPDSSQRTSYLPMTFRETS